MRVFLMVASVLVGFAAAGLLDDFFARKLFSDSVSDRRRLHSSPSFPRRRRLQGGTVGRQRFVARRPAQDFQKNSEIFSQAHPRRFRNRGFSDFQRNFENFGPTNFGRL
ncbi:unnamed protein product [Caenorhabditis angaria]|uniref:Uncharacterized protein n=1 Tax=Caenorhabditis angaria TaxID=860376 RepID=A0A9P1MXE7_9PELO|nr:unnamed protein product [Caenorhabditis angaria]